MVYTARRVRRCAAWLAMAGLPFLMAAGCAGPQFNYATDSSAQTYFKVPNQWHKIDDSSLQAQLKSHGFVTGTGIWDVGYDANGAPSATHVLDATATKPFALAFVTPLSQTGVNEMSYNLLRDFLFPVTPAGRQAAARSGFPLTGFRLLSDSIVTPGKDVHGIREIFQYTYPSGGTDTFDQVALTNSDSTMVYLLLVHCLSTCYSHNASQIDTVMKSFTVGSP